MSDPLSSPDLHSRSARHAQGLLFGAAAYALWGLFPLYWPLLEPAGAVEILAHRIAWSALTMAILVVALRRTAAVGAAPKNALQNFIDRNL